MMKKRAAIIFIMGMVLAIGLTACQKSDNKKEESSGQAEVILEETRAVEKEDTQEPSGSEQQTVLSDVNDESLVMLAEAFDFAAIP